jgi:lysophospholipase L1-like esterase
VKLATYPAVVFLTLASGCGEKHEPSLGKEPAKAQVVAALGDSITAGSPLWDPDEKVREAIGSQADPESQYGYWAQLRLKGTSFRNCGVFGERTEEIAARLDSCAEGARFLIVQGGINDIAQRQPVGDAARNLREMAARGRSRGLGVALTEVLPWNNGHPGAARAIRRLNRAIARIGRELGVPVLPWYAKLEDPARPGRMKAEWTIDGDHPSVTGYRRLAQTVRLRGLGRTPRRSSAR